MAYTTVDDLREYLKLTSTAEDALLSRIIDAAQLAIDTYCGWSFEALQDSTRIYDGIADVYGRELILHEPWVSLTTVTNGDGEILAAGTDFITTTPRNVTPFFAIRLLGSSGKSWNYDEDPEIGPKVSGKQAYSEAAGPDIKLACELIAGFLYRQRNNADVDRAIIAGNATILAATMPQSAKFMLGPYRRVA